MLYALQLPDGTIEPDTVSDSQDAAWGESFEHVAYHLGSEWADRFWKKWGESRQSASRRGYKIVPVTLRHRDTAKECQQIRELLDSLARPSGGPWPRGYVSLQMRREDYEVLRELLASHA